MQLGDLTTLANVKAWLATTSYVVSSSPDIVLRQLITRWSAYILAYLERPWILPRQYTEAYDGKGQNLQFLRNWPVQSVTEVSINGQILTPSPVVPGGATGYQYGYRLEGDSGDPPGNPQSVAMIGGRFWKGFQNIIVTYNAGYQVTDELWEVPEPDSSGVPPQLIVLQPQGIWGNNVSVVYASDGVALTQVSSTPTVAGTYQVIQPDTVLLPNTLSPPGLYIFADADQNEEVLITYGYIPGALEQIAIELILERFVYRNRIGEVSRSMAGQITTKYDNSEIPPYARPGLQRFKSVLPL